MGVTPDLLERVASGVDLVSLDTAHDHSHGVLDAVRAIKAAHPTLAVMAGNVATAAGARALADAGADCVKVGMGSGSIYTTRIIIGIGIPQFTAVREAASGFEGTGVNWSRTGAASFRAT